MSEDTRESGAKLGLVRPTGSLGADQRMAASWYCSTISATSEPISEAIVANFYNLGDKTTGFRYLTKRQIKTIRGGQN